MCEMFENNAKFVGTGLSKWDTTKVGTGYKKGAPNKYDMKKMFKKCKQFNQDLSKWIIANVNSFASTFYGTDALTTCNKKKIADSWGDGSRAPHPGIKPVGQNNGNYNTEGGEDGTCAATCGDADGYMGPQTAAVSDKACGSGYVYDSTKIATDCASGICDAGRDPDRSACCKLTPMSNEVFKAAT
jgi:hypothetical protein